MAFTKEETSQILHSAELIKDFLNKNINPDNFDDRDLNKIILHASNIIFLLSSELEDRAITSTEKGYKYEILDEYRRKESKEELSKMFNFN